MRIEGHFVDTGVCRAFDVLGPDQAKRLATVIEDLHEGGRHPLFAYEEPGFWSLGEDLRRSFSALRGTAYRLVEDVWAFRVAPGASGWSPHRGVTARLSRRAPEVVNLWVSLSDAEEDRACMHAIPLDDDPRYPQALDAVDVPQGRWALPTRAGDVLAWNANVLHWGGACAPTARGPRIACTFTLATDAFAAANRLRCIDDVEGLDPEARLDILARQIATYADTAQVAPDLRRWATARLAILSFAGRKDR